MAVPILVDLAFWYEGDNWSEITSVRIVDLYDPSLLASGVTVTQSWPVDADGTGSIMCYELSDLTVIIAGNGSGKIMASTDCASGFEGCASLESIEGLGLLDTSNATTMARMFLGCQKLTNLDLTGFKTGSVTNMDSMFYNCPMLTTILVSDRWSTENVAVGSNMFYGNTKIVGGNGTIYSGRNVGVEYACIDTSETPGYFTYKKYVPAALRGDHIIQGETLYEIAEAIRSKTGSTDSLTPSQMAAAILGIGAS